MAIRERTELLEEQILSPFATLAKQTKGRQRPEQECDIRTAFQRDRDRIIHSKSFRRLKHKTQVFLSPEAGPLSYTSDAYAGSGSNCPYSGKSFTHE